MIPKQSSCPLPTSYLRVPRFSECDRLDCGRNPSSVKGQTTVRAGICPLGTVELEGEPERLRATQLTNREKEIFVALIVDPRSHASHCASHFIWNEVGGNYCLILRKDFSQVTTSVHSWYSISCFGLMLCLERIAYCKVVTIPE